jgi:hypothetical protein
MLLVLGLMAPVLASIVNPVVDEKVPELFPEIVTGSIIVEVEQKGESG